MPRRRRNKSKSSPMNSPMQAPPSPNFRAPQQSDNLIALIEMFPHIEPQVAMQVLQYHRSLDDAISYLLTEMSVSGTDSKGSSGSQEVQINSGGGWYNLPEDAFLLICEHLSIVSIGTLGRVCRSYYESAKLCYERVETLHLSRYKYWSDTSLLSFAGRFPTLKYLSLKNLANFRSFSLLPSCNSKLETLSLDGCRHFEDSDMEVIIRHMKNLTALDVSYCAITNESLGIILEEQRQLQRLSLVECRDITSNGICAVLTRIPSLTNLNLKSTTIGPQIQDVFNRSKLGLTKLNISNCTAINRFSLAPPLNYCNLKILNISNNKNLRVLSLLGLSALEQLYVSNCRGLTTMVFGGLNSLQTIDASMGLELRHIDIKTTTQMPILTINLFQCRSLSSISFDGLLEACQDSVMSLNCGGMIQLSDPSVERLMKGFSQLTAVNTSGCKSLSSRLAVEVSGTYPYLVGSDSPHKRRNNR